jgi:hypothetical protein
MMALALVRVNDGVFANEGTGIWLAQRGLVTATALRGRGVTRQDRKFHDPTFRKSPYRYQTSNSMRSA